jgi:hypothetical protein
MSHENSMKMHDISIFMFLSMFFPWKITIFPNSPMVRSQAVDNSSPRTACRPHRPKPGQSPAHHCPALQLQGGGNFWAVQVQVNIPKDVENHGNKNMSFG